MNSAESLKTFLATLSNSDENLLYDIGFVRYPDASTDILQKHTLLKDVKNIIIVCSSFFLIPFANSMPFIPGIFMSKNTISNFRFKESSKSNPDKYFFKKI